MSGDLDKRPLREQIEEDGLENACRRFYSIYRATVSTVLDTAQQGRIKVIVPAISDTELGYPAIPLAPFAGNGFGIFFPPRPGDAVLVMFEQGLLSAPYYVGGWWGNPAGVSSELPAEIFNPLVPTSTRLIKTPQGHALIFQDDDLTGAPNTRVELRTAKQVYPPGGGAPSITVHHQLIMSDLLGYVELSSTGEDGPGINYHFVRLDDKQQMLTIESGGKHKLIMSDLPAGNGSIKLQTLGGHTIVMDDKGTAPKISITTQGGSSIVLDDTKGAQKVSISTPLKRQVTLDDTGPGSILVQDPTGNSVLMGPQGVTVKAAAAVAVTAAGACTVAATGAVAVSGAGVSVSSSGGPTSSYSTGIATALLLGGVFQIIVGVVAIMLTGAVTLTVIGPLTVFASTIILGNAGALALVNANIITWLATHTHTVAPGTGVTGGPTSVPIQAAALASPTYVTQNLKAS